MKTRSWKSKKIKIFPRGLVLDFGPKLTIFSSFFKGQYRPGKCVLRYSTTIFYAIKTKSSKSWKIEVFPKSLGHNLFLKNVNFSTFWSSCFYGLERCFFVLEYHKTHFPCLHCLKKDRKMANFGPKPWTNSFGKISIFLTLCTSCFYSLGRRFFRSRISSSTFSFPILPRKKKMKKWPILDQNQSMVLIYLMRCKVELPIN